LVSIEKSKNQVEIKLLQLEFEEDVGGFDLDLILLQHLISVADTKFGLTGNAATIHSNTWAAQKSIRNSPKSVAKLLLKVRDLKEDLSASQKSTLRLEEFHEGQDFTVTVTRKEFEDLTQDIYPKFNALVKRIVENNKVDSIELYGGAQRVPIAVKSLKSLLNDKLPVGRHIDGEESPVNGAAYYLASLKGGKTHSLRTQTHFFSQ
jgi:hypoxia up-regulated 1